MGDAARLLRAHALLRTRRHLLPCMSLAILSPTGADDDGVDTVSGDPPMPLTCDEVRTQAPAWMRSSGDHHLDEDQTAQMFRLWNYIESCLAEHGSDECPSSLRSYIHALHDVCHGRSCSVLPSFPTFQEQQRATIRFRLGELLEGTVGNADELRTTITEWLHSLRSSEDPA